MRLLINIPKEFEQHFQADRFEDSLHRLRADIHLMAGLYEQETAEMLIDAFKNAVPVPPHGRLIDADALEDYCSRLARDEWNESTCTSWGYAYASFANDVEDAPTIIEAEEGEHGRD